MRNKPKTVVVDVEKQLLGKYANPERGLGGLEWMSGGDYERLLVAQAERAAARLRAGRLPRRGVQAETGNEGTAAPGTRKTG